MGWSLLDHTGDLGLEVEASSLESLFTEALRGFSDCLTDVALVRRRVERRVDLAASDREILLVDWLQEALFLFDTEALVFSHAEVVLAAAGAAGAEGVGLRSRLLGEVFDPRRHPLKAPIKAVTYHALELTGEDTRWRARLVFDL